MTTVSSFLTSFALQAFACAFIALIFEACLICFMSRADDDSDIECGSSRTGSEKHTLDDENAEDELREKLILYQYSLEPNTILECSDAVCY